MHHHNFGILANPWAITEEALNAIFSDLKSGHQAEQVMAGQAAGGSADLEVRDSIAIIPVRGAMYRFSYESIRRKVNAAMGEDSVRAVVLKVNSPGGLVAGCKELADFIHDAGKIKNIYAYADGDMCSAAYWIGSAAKNIAAPVTAGIGSIGVRTLHVDWSGWNENAGLSFTHLAAGSYKTLGNEDEPLNKKARDYFQSQLDTLYSIFIDSVAKNLGVDPEKALSMADGKVFLAKEAKDLGLINRIEQDFESYFSFILKKEKIMDLATLKADHADLYSQIIKEGEARGAESAKAKTAEAVQAETERVLGIAGIVGGDALSEKITGVVKSGATVEMVKSVHGSLADDGDPGSGETATRQKILDGIEQAHSEGLNQQTKAGKPGQKSLEDQASEFSSLVNE